MDQLRFAGDLGKSLITRRDVTLELFERIPATAYLGDHWYNPINVYRHSSLNFGRTKRKTYVENATQILALAGIFIPEFWFAIMAVLLFLLHLGWLPSSGYTSIYLTLPAIAIGFRQAANTTRLTRSSMLDEMNTEYVDTARSSAFASERPSINSRSETR